MEWDVYSKIRDDMEALRATLMYAYRNGKAEGKGDVLLEIRSKIQDVGSLIKSLLEDT